ncbi:MAG: hypothetical protein AB7E45_00040 [Candidatus Caldatribacteriota bacterium]|jgi:hypothetical protein
MSRTKQNKDWISGAIKKKGSFTSWCKSKGYGGVTEDCISKGKNSKDPKTRKRANLAETLRNMKNK